MGVYIRIKHRTNASGNEYDYAYLVQWRWRKRNYAQQHHLHYLGRIYTLPKQKNHYLALNHALDQTSILKDLIRRELAQHGFTPHKTLYHNSMHYVDIDKSLVYDRKGKDIVLQLNAGFLCTHSIHKLLNYTLLKNHKKDMKTFAQTLALTGIDLAPHEFVELYQTLAHHEP